MENLYSLWHKTGDDVTLEQRVMMIEKRSCIDNLNSHCFSMFQSNASMEVVIVSQPINKRMPMAWRRVSFVDSNHQWTKHYPYTISTMITSRLERITNKPSPDSESGMSRRCIPRSSFFSALCPNICNNK